VLQSWSLTNFAVSKSGLVVPLNVPCMRRVTIRKSAMTTNAVCGIMDSTILSNRIVKSNSPRQCWIIGPNAVSPKQLLNMVTMANSWAAHGNELADTATYGFLPIFARTIVSVSGVLKVQT
jgi:hypothetical protein